MILTTVALGAPALVRNEAQISNRAKKNVGTVSTLALSGVGAAAISSATKGKSFGWNTAINKGIKNFLGKISNSEKFANNKFFKGIQKVGEKIAKSSGRQKLLAGLALATAVAVIGIRDHYSKKQGAENQKNIDGKKYAAIKNAYTQKFQAKDNEIETLKTEVDIKNDEIKAWNDTVAKFEKAAEKVGVADKIAAELQNADKK